MGKGEKVR